MYVVNIIGLLIGMTMYAILVVNAQEKIESIAHIHQALISEADEEWLNGGREMKTEVEDPFEKSAYGLAGDINAHVDDTIKNGAGNTATLRDPPMLTLTNVAGEETDPRDTIRVSKNRSKKTRMEVSTV